MSTEKHPQKVLLLGSGALKIGQAGEFDYSGTQAIKALKEEGRQVVLINPNIATIQTSEGLADTLYLLPVEVDFVERVIVLEQPDAILLAFGGQTALNCGVALQEQGILERYNVRVLGTPVSAIQITEDRERFNTALAEIDVKTARSVAATTVDEAVAAAQAIGFPVMMRGAFALGGRGSAIVGDSVTCRAAAERAFASVPQLLVEECLQGWKEIEYEVVRDAAGNCITVCNMENVDPMGIHTGESIVVAPSQTLNDHEYQMLRDVAIQTIHHLGVVGESNIQYALDPQTSDYRVIEVNARLSRSSALASKATGYPLAYVAAKIALGYDLPDIPNSMTRSTTSFFEPALDYLVCKMPRWDLEKFEGVHAELGPEMKSVGEVMAIGRSFPEALQKALRMLELGVDGLDDAAYGFDDVEQALRRPSPRRIFAVAAAFRAGMSVDTVFEMTRIDRFFLREIARVVTLAKSLQAHVGGLDALSAETLEEVKRAGFSDGAIGRALGLPGDPVQRYRRALGVRPSLAQIDTLAGEYPAETNYLYMTYAASGHDVVPSGERERVLVLGSGAYRIGSSVEFDWCAVNAVTTARELGYETVLLNCNPETVSTDYDVCDRLIFDEVTLETVLEVCAVEQPLGVIVSMGGQTSNNLALKLHEAGIPVLGTPPACVDRAEDRGKFSALLDTIGIDQPRWAEATARDDLDALVRDLGGYPVLVRPSYVLSGAAMKVVYNAAQLGEVLEAAGDVSPEHPVVVSKFERRAREIELDAVARDGVIEHWAITEHVEDAGVHSGDATLVLPPERLYLGTIRQVRRIGEALARELQVTGPFNVQMLARSGEVKVIECNLRASRSFPLVSKALGVSFIRAATRAILGAEAENAQGRDPLDPGHVVVKVPQFSFGRLRGVDPVLGVEMASTGEVACFGRDMSEALLQAMIAVGYRYPTQGVLMAIGSDAQLHRFVETGWEVVRQGLPLYATPVTAQILSEMSVPCTPVGLAGDDVEPKALELIREGVVDLVISVPPEYIGDAPDVGMPLRRAAVDQDVPLLLEAWLARRVVQAMGRYRREALGVRSWQSFLGR